MRESNQIKGRVREAQIKGAERRGVGMTRGKEKSGVGEKRQKGSGEGRYILGKHGALRHGESSYGGDSWTCDNT